VGGTRARAVALVNDEPREVVGGDGEWILQLRMKERGLGVDQTKEKEVFAWCSPDGGDGGRDGSNLGGCSGSPRPEWANRFGEHRRRRPQARAWMGGAAARQ
jgi:hypothetical protein